QSGRYDIAYETWNTLLGQSRVSDPWVPLIMGQIEGIADAAGIRWRPPQLGSASPFKGPGPSAEDVEAASQMSAEDRAVMIRGMVESLSARLAQEGGAPEEWARLINALGVLGETDRARAIWIEAQAAFEPYPDAVDTIRLAAERAGVAQ
ncbi:MAG: c-type cytochrome biogenesis protein CcmI, partial [Pseudomonadota bacterium]